MNKHLLALAVGVLLAVGANAQNTNSSSQNNGQGIIHWKLDGNTANDNHFIGTVNEKPLVFKANSLEGIRLLTDGSIKLEQLKLQPNENTFGFPRMMVIDDDGTLKVLQGLDLDHALLKIIIPSLGDIHFPTADCSTPGGHQPRWFSERSTATSPAKLLAWHECTSVYVGINSDIADFPLDVNGDSRFRGNALIKGAGGFNSNGDQAFLMLGDASHYIKSTNGVGVSIGTFGYPDIMLLSQANGNVGIGTTNPQFKLDVDGGGRFYNGNPDNYIRIAYNGANAIIDNFGQGSLLINYYSGKDVVIGKDETPADLSVSGRGKFRDGAWASEFTVTHPANFPDYVFKDDYKLMPLNELENYIKLEGHLPNIPTAEQVHANGLDLGEMNRLLVEKVEELTLYIIELQKQQVLLQQKVDALEGKK